MSGISACGSIGPDSSTEFRSDPASCLENGVSGYKEGQLSPGAYESSPSLREGHVDDGIPADDATNQNITHSSMGTWPSIHLERLSQREKPADDSIPVRYRPYRIDQEFVPFWDDRKFKVFVDDHGEEIIRIVVASGSVLEDGQRREFEETSFCFYSAAEEPILDAMKEDALFKLEPRGRGDHNSVLVIARDDIKAHLVGVETHQFDDDPLDQVTSTIRIYEYIDVLCDTIPGLCLRSAAVSARNVFGADPFDSCFRSYRDCADSVPFGRAHRMRVVEDVNRICQTANMIARNGNASGLNRVLHYRFGGDRSGPFVTTLADGDAIQNSKSYTRRCERSMEMIGFPSYPDEVFIAHCGQLHRRLRLDQVRAAAWGICRVEAGTIVNGFKIVCVNLFGDGTVSYGVWALGTEFDQDGINELETKYNHDLFPAF